MSPRNLILFALVPVLVAAAGCNELVGARRYHVRDGSVTPLRDANVTGDSMVPLPDGGPPPDAGDCDPSELETYYLDSDGDTHGRTDVAIQACSLPDGYAMRDGDCNDGVPTAFPGASETCDDVDSDCDGTVDEGLFGPVGAPLSLIPAVAGAGTQPAVAAYSGGYFVANGGQARWLDETAMPTTAAFNYRFGGAFPNGDRVELIVFEDTSPPRGVIAHYERSPEWLTVTAISADETSTALTGITVLRPPNETRGDDTTMTDLYTMRLLRIENQIVVLAPFTGGDDVSLLRAGAFNPTTWTETGSFSEYYLNSFDNAFAVAGTTPSAILGVRNTDGISAWGELVWLTVSASGPTIARNPSLELPGGSQIHVPSSNVPARDEFLAVVDDGTLCAERFSIPLPGQAFTLPECPAAITWEPDQMQVRQGVVSVITGASQFREEPFAPGTDGTPGVALPSRGPMAVRGGRGLIVFVQAGALMGQRLGCRTP